MNLDEKHDRNKLKIDLIRAVQMLKASGREVSIPCVAYELFVPQAMIYDDLEFVELIFSEQDKFSPIEDALRKQIVQNKILLQGVDTSKQEKNTKIGARQECHYGTTAERANSRLRNSKNRSVLLVHEDFEDDENAEVEVLQGCHYTEDDVRKAYASGFSEGARMNVTINTASTNDEKIIWAKGVLGFDLNNKPTLPEIKKAYKTLIRIIHPDQSQSETGYMFNCVAEAYKILIKHLTK